jgi:gliding motility-associated-like protein
VETPFAVAVDKENNIYIADWDDNRIRKVTALTGIISTLAGTGEQGIAGDGGPAIKAQLYGPQTVEVDTLGNVYISEIGGEYTFINGKVRRVNQETGIISSIAGNGTIGHSGDGGPAEEAQLMWGDHVAIDREGNIYLADQYYIRKITNYPLPLPQIKYSCLANGMSFQIQAEFPVYNVKWDFGDPESLTFNTAEELTPVHKFSAENKYSVRAIVDSDIGRDSLEVIVNVENCICHIEIPNVFTPNNDTYNDEYHVITDCALEVYQMSITNRWGDEVFSSNDVNRAWDGRDCSSGVYFLSITYKFSGLPLRNKKTTVSLFR